MKEHMYQRNVAILNWTTVVLIMYVVLDVFIFASTTCIKGHETVGHMAIMFTTLFGVLGFIFFISGTAMALALKKYYPDFYKEYGGLIWLATFFLALPLFLRAIHSMLYQRGDGHKYHDYY